MKPNFMIIGSAKCGTTSLAFSLGTHPEVFMCEPKEPHFFSRDENYIKGASWYESLFNQSGSAKMRGEASTNYTMKEAYPECLPRIVSYSTDLKLIYIVRHPLDRIASLWAQYRLTWSRPEQRVHHNFSRALHTHKKLLVDSANYLSQIDSYRQFFPDNQIHVIFFEDFTQNPLYEIQQCFQFLEVDPTFIPPAAVTHLNKTDGSQKMQSPLHSKLRSMPPYRALTNVLPAPLKSGIKSLKPINQMFTLPHHKPKWDSASLDWAAALLVEPSLMFLDRYDKPKDFWKFK